MARLASISKAGFYPIPPALLPAVGAAVVLDWGTPDGSRSYQTTRHAVLDPCAGEGDAVFPLATMWRGKQSEDFQAFACELEATRFASLTARCRGLVPNDEDQRIAELEAEIARLSQTMGAKPAVLLGSVREPRTVAIALLNLAEQQPVDGDLFRWLVQESRAWAALER